MRILPLVATSALLLLSTGCDLSAFLDPPEEEPSRRRDRSGNDDGPSDAGVTNDAGGENPPPPPPCTGGGCPRILSLSTNVSTLGPSTSVIVSAVVTDPDGIDDLIGGTLFDPTSNGTYGTFQTAASEGAYELSVSWSALNEVRALDFSGGGERVLRARFFDQAGNETLGDVRISLSCDGRDACDGRCGYARCGSECVTDTFDEDDHCGGCNQACPGELACVSYDPFLDQPIPPSCMCNGEAGGYNQCGNSCVSFLDDPDNCGGCGLSCGGDSDCTMGACSCYGQAGQACTGPHGSGSCVQARIGANTVADLCFATGEGRLAGGNADEGFLEVEVNGIYRQVCTDDFIPDANLANVWCQRLRGRGGRLELRDREVALGFTMACEAASVESCAIAAIEVYSGCPSFDEPVYLICDGGDVEPPPPPPPDGDFSCSEGTLSANGTLTGSTASEDDTRAMTCGDGGGADRAVSFTAPAAGSYTFSTAGSAYDTILEVFADCASGASSLGCNDDFSGTTSQVTIDLAANQQVLVVVDGYGGATGSFMLTVSH